MRGGKYQHCRPILREKNPKNPTVRLGVRALRHEELTYGRFLMSIIKLKLFIDEDRHFPPYELFEFAICA